jgi:hypothetical protein
MCCFNASLVVQHVRNVIQQNLIVNNVLLDITYIKIFACLIVRMDISLKNCPQTLQFVVNVLDYVKLASIKHFA